MFKRFIKSYLLHLLILWLLINTYNTLNYLYKLSIWGPLSLNPDGTPITAWQMFVTHNIHRPDYLYLAFFVLFVELNYSFIFKRYKLWQFFVCTVSTGLIITIILLYFNTHGFTNKYPTNIFEPAVVIIGYTLLYAFIREFFYQRLYKLKVRADRSENELRALKQQLDPHFLFNTLNYLFGTALQENAVRTAEGIDMMADMMRYSVTGMQQVFVPLPDELSFIEQYIKLQQLRMPLNETQRVSIQIRDANQPLQIAPMLLIPFIENAFKFGISADHATNINLKINITGSELFMDLSNTIIPGRENVKGTKSGLALTQKRLNLLYSNKHQLQILTANGEYRVKLTLHLK